MEVFRVHCKDLLNKKGSSKSPFDSRKSEEIGFFQTCQLGIPAYVGMTYLCENDIFNDFIKGRLCFVFKLLNPVPGLRTIEKGQITTNFKFPVLDP